VLTNRIYNYLLRNNILPEEQKGCCRMPRVYKDQLLASKMITSLAKKHQRHLCMAWIDYKKALDSLSHTWIDTVTEMYQICPTIRQFVEASMKERKTKMWLYHTKGHVEIKVPIKWGIFQGDSLSPLLFSLALTSLTNMLNKQEAGYEVEGKNKISHLSYMDD